jgi:hypothetical protein
MGVMLLNEQRLGDKSRLSAYVDQLPASYDAPVLWDDAQLHQLQYPPLIAAVSDALKLVGAILLAGSANGDGGL